MMLDYGYTPEALLNNIEKVTPVAGGLRPPQRLARR